MIKNEKIIKKIYDSSLEIFLMYNYFKLNE